ncbi:hypothetical protein SERLADRAFT_431919 [Serpula lacrymans var. lacrymans S7.9]|uniref:CxC1-like cysteine cluster associated with KDZ transposases domain-containing protein n=1 Tax=Serpula lacrymans var. lacrymans (strain S7.9) TaxID=578457 RepID=F8NE55_SERL9|nr:uncharacterized protein SERLADRAFT_431919 [Serpula lacrymans var. lacrymans S7.9]EGO30384.1 hypothetical protein SERLADRAFT_431919 [Serpula lacrymans var. lacrymans S7.9]
MYKAACFPTDGACPVIINVPSLLHHECSCTHITQLNYHLFFPPTILAAREELHKTYWDIHDTLDEEASTPIPEYNDDILPILSFEREPSTHIHSITLDRVPSFTTPIIYLNNKFTMLFHKQSTISTIKNKIVNDLLDTHLHFYHDHCKWRGGIVIIKHSHSDPSTATHLPQRDIGLLNILVPACFGRTSKVQKAGKQAHRVKEANEKRLHQIRDLLKDDGLMIENMLSDHAMADIDSNLSEPARDLSAHYDENDEEYLEDLAHEMADTTGYAYMDPCTHRDCTEVQNSQWDLQMDYLVQAYLTYRHMDSMLQSLLDI